MRTKLHHKHRSYLYWVHMYLKDRGRESTVIKDILKNGTYTREEGNWLNSMKSEFKSFLPWVDLDNDGFLVMFDKDIWFVDDIIKERLHEKARYGTPFLLDRSYGYRTKRHGYVDYVVVEYNKVGTVHNT